ncbi:MAG: periplasmic heavy metal sensor [Alphaproteobacteria bacterium]|nr:periplasmic heavy metal sensor [Alphaproteobacteria bacterium]
MVRKHLAWILLGLSLALNVAFVGGFVHARYFAEPSPIVDLRPGSGLGSPAPMPTVSKPGPGPSPAEIARELGLSDGQMRGLRQMIAEQRRRAGPVVREMVQQRDLLVAELGKERPDAAIIDRALDRIGQLRTQLQKDGVQAALHFAETLPAEQRDKFRRVMVNRAMGQQGVPPGLRDGRRAPPPDRK